MKGKKEKKIPQKTATTTICLVLFVFPSQTRDLHLENYKENDFCFLVC
jgi:hypothetical protein